MAHETLTRWGILGTGNQACCFSRATKASENHHVIAVSGFCDDMIKFKPKSEWEQLGMDFCDTMEIPAYHETFQELLKDPRIDAVYLPLPNTAHAKWCINAAQAGKHILCEKPFATSSAEGAYVTEFVRSCRVRLLVAYKYETQRWFVELLERIRSGEIGTVRAISVTRVTRIPADPRGRHFSLELGGGSILDMGPYCTHLAGKIAGAVDGTGFSEPTAVHACAALAETGVDEYSSACVEFANGIVGTLTCGLGLYPVNTAEITGTRGSIKITNLYNGWTFDTGGYPRVYLANMEGMPRRNVDGYVEVGPPPEDARAIDNFLDRFHDPAFPQDAVWKEYVADLYFLDRWRRSVGVTFTHEKRFARRKYFSSRDKQHEYYYLSADDISQTTLYTGAVPLLPPGKRRSNEQQIPRVFLAGLERQVSQLILGGGRSCDLLTFDQYWQSGGNCLITGHQYDCNDGDQKAVAHWLRSRDIRREKVILVILGAHTPCSPEAMSDHLMQSLECLQTDYIDLFLPHRDNPSVPVGEFLEALNEHLRAGHIRAFGASNWSLQRYEEANRWAQSHGLTAMSILSNYFGVAEIDQMPWTGAVSVTGANAMERMIKDEVVLMPYSSQGKGFFKDAAGSDRRGVSKRSFLKALQTPGNAERRRRVLELASKKGVEPTALALAYVLHQPFITFPLIGPRNCQQLSASLSAVHIELSPENVKWLESGP